MVVFTGVVETVIQSTLIDLKNNLIKNGSLETFNNKGHTCLRKSIVLNLLGGGD